MLRGLFLTASSLALLAYAEEELKNLGVDCRFPCEKKQGPCAFCGTRGMCCRHGWHKYNGGCDGKLGIPGRHHVCVAPPSCQDVGKKSVCVRDRRGECMWDDDVGCMDFVARPKPQGCQCESYGDPHIKPFCFDKKAGDKKQDCFQAGEYLQFESEDLTVHMRTEMTPRRIEITANTAVAWHGKWTCGQTYELHIGNVIEDQSWTPPTAFEPRLIIHDSLFMSDRATWDPSTTLQYEGVAQIIAALKADTCPMFTVEGGVSASVPDGKEEIKINFWDGSFMDLKDFNHPLWGLNFFMHMQTYNQGEVKGLCDPQAESTAVDGDGSTCGNLLTCPTLFTYYIDEDMPYHTNTNPRRGTWTFQDTAGAMGELTDDMALDAAHCGNIPTEETPAPLEECEQDLITAATEYCKECDDEQMREDCLFDICLGGTVESGASVLNSCIGKPDIPTYYPSRTPSLSPTQTPVDVVVPLPTPTPVQDCEMSDWSEWEECTASCGEGVEWSFRQLVQPASPGGNPCPINNEKSRPCYMGVCPEPTPNPTRTPTPEPTTGPTRNCSLNDKDTCKLLVGECVWNKDDKKCDPYVPTISNPQGECKSHGDPHIRPFGNKPKFGMSDWDFFMHGEWDLYNDYPKLLVQSRTEWAPRFDVVTSNTAIAMSGSEFCGKTYELHLGNPECMSHSGKPCMGNWVSPVAFEPMLLVHNTNTQHDRAGWNPSATLQYSGINDVINGFKTNLAGCGQIKKVETSNKFPKESVKIIFADESFIYLREWAHPFWGISFILHSKNIPPTMTGLCKSGMENSAPDTLQCPSLFTYYPDPEADKFYHRDFPYYLPAAYQGEWKPENALKPEPCLQFERPKDGWVPNPPLTCPSELEAEAKVFCAECEAIDVGMYRDCIFDICIDGTTDGGIAVLNNCLELPKFPTYTPTAFPVEAPATCDDMQDSSDSCTGVDGCTWSANLADSDNLKPCHESTVDPCNAFNGKKNGCGGESKGCEYDKKSKVCSLLPTGGCALQNGNKNGCRAIPGCSYKAGKCTGTPEPLEGCALHTAGGKKACVAVNGCRFKKGLCTGTPVPLEGCALIGQDGKNACVAQNGCKWKKNKCSGTPVELEGCAAETANGKSACVGVFGCRWKKNKCQGTPKEAPTGCAAYDKATCKTKPGCFLEGKKCAGEEVTLDRKCGLAADAYPNYKFFTLQAKNAKQSTKHDVVGIDTEDAACVCYETCLAEADKIYWSFLAKGKEEGICRCYTSNHKGMTPAVNSAGAMGGLNADSHAEVAPPGA